MDGDLVTATMASPVGPLTVTVSGAGLARVRWGEGHADGDTRAEPVLAQLAEYFAGTRRAFDVPLDWRYTSRVQRAVLGALAGTVGYGQTLTYGQLAARSGTGIPARAIGTIMGGNPIPILVPCHRVLAHDGLGGYSGGAEHDGLEVKRWLLTLEGALPPTLDWNPAGLPG